MAAAVNPSSPPSSPLSSVGSRSPTPPAGYPDYPSPASSNASETDLSSQPPRPDESAPSLDGPPPAKRPRIMKPRELKTEYLDLCALGDTSDEAQHRAQEANLKKLVDTLRLKRKIVVVAGAGISVSAGSKLLQRYSTCAIWLKLNSS